MSTAKSIYASGWQRTGASTIDSIIFIIASSIFKIITPDFFMQNFAYTLFFTTYYIWTESSSSQATVGKKLIGIYVATKQLGKPSVQLITLRYFFLMLPAIPFLIIQLLPSFTVLFTNLSTLQDQPHKLVAYLQQPDTFNDLLVYVVSLLVTIIGGTLFSLPICFTKEKTGLHDWLSKTRVYRKQPEVKAIAP